MINPRQLHDLIVKPTLSQIGLDQPGASQLLMGTYLHESTVGGDTCVKQLGGGPALGIYQMEPATHNDIWKNYLKYKEELASYVLTAIGLDSDNLPDAERMIWDLKYATCMARVHYRRDPGILPASTDLIAQAEYYKKVYNTHLGAATPDDFKKAVLKSGIKDLWGIRSV
tara:strand:+ start:6480 stop:6989 length:510 start_codon:yes stop_codon:yes gene_type:complete